MLSKKFLLSPCVACVSSGARLDSCAHQSLRKQAQVSQDEELICLAQVVAQLLPGDLVSRQNDLRVQMGAEGQPNSAQRGSVHPPPPSCIFSSGRVVVYWPGLPGTRL